MSYTKQNFTDGQVLTAAHMNHIEEGIVAAEGSELDTSSLTFSLYQKMLGASDISGSITSANGQTLTLAGNANSYAEATIPVSDISTQMIRVTASVSAVNGSMNIVLAGTKKSSTESETVTLGSVKQAGKFSLMVDLAYQDVYGALDMAKPVTLRFVLAAAQNSITMDNFEVSKKTAESTYIKETDSSMPEILDAIRKDISQSSKNENTCVISPNGKKYILQVSNDGNAVFVPILPNKALFIGNSLLVGFGSFGMCATGADKDYYYHVTQTIAAKNNSFSPSKAAGSGIEGATDTSTFDTAFSSIESKLTSDLDLVVVQLGDNINTDEKIRYFKNEGSVRLLKKIREKCPNARVCWVAAWYTNSDKQEMFKEACSQTGCLFIDISDLVTPENKGKIGDVINKGDSTETVTAAGVASHPGDKGMAAIAKRICEKLGMVETISEGNAPEEPETVTKTVLSSKSYATWTNSVPLLSGYNLPFTPKVNMTLKRLKFKLQSDAAATLRVVIHDTVENKDIAEATADIVQNTTDGNEVNVAFNAALTAGRFYKIYVGTKDGSKVLHYPSYAESNIAENEYFSITRADAGDYLYSQKTIVYGGYVTFTVTSSGSGSTDVPETGAKTVLSTKEYQRWNINTPLCSGYNLPFTPKVNMTLKGLRFKLQSDAAATLRVVINDTVENKDLAEATADIVQNTTDGNEVNVTFNAALTAGRLYRIYVGTKDGSKVLHYPDVNDDNITENEYFSISRDNVDDYQWKNKKFRFGGYVTFTV